MVTFIEFIVFGIQALIWYCKYRGDDDSENEQKKENVMKNSSAELNEV